MVVTEFLGHTRKQLPLPKFPYPLNLIMGITDENEECVLQIAQQCGGLKIPHAYDAVVVWHYNNDMEIHEIAQQLQLSEDTVRGYLNEAKDRPPEVIVTGRNFKDPVTKERLPLPELPFPLGWIGRIINKHGEEAYSESNEDIVLEIAWKFGGRQIPHAHDVSAIFLWNKGIKIKEIAKELRMSEDIVCGYLSEAGLKNAEEFTLEPHILWNIKRKSATTAYLAAFLGGLFGIHRFYLGGKTKTAFFMLFSGCFFSLLLLIGVSEQDIDFKESGLFGLLIPFAILVRDLICLNAMVEKRNREMAKEIWE